MGRPHALPWIAFALLAALGVAAPPAGAVERAGLEAAIVYNVLLFVEWPGEAALAAGEPLTLCLDGSSPVARELRALAGRPVRRMKLALRDIADGDGLRGCNALYVDSELARKAAARPDLDRAILVIGGSEPAPLASATIQLAQAEGRFVFDVDTRLAKQSGLVVSSRLLRLARKVVE